MPGPYGRGSNVSDVTTTYAHNSTQGPLHIAAGPDVSEITQQQRKYQPMPGHMRLQSMHRHNVVQGFIRRSKPWKFPA